MIRSVEDESSVGGGRSRLPCIAGNLLDSQAIQTGTLKPLNHELESSNVVRVRATAVGLDSKPEHAIPSHDQELGVERKAIAAQRADVHESFLLGRIAVPVTTGQRQ